MSDIPAALSEKDFPRGSGLHHLSRNVTRRLSSFLFQTWHGTPWRPMARWQSKGFKALCLTFRLLSLKKTSREVVVSTTSQGMSLEGSRPFFSRLDMVEPDQLMESTILHMPSSHSGTVPPSPQHLSGLYWNSSSSPIRGPFITSTSLLLLRFVPAAIYQIRPVI